MRLGKLWSGWVRPLFMTENEKRFAKAYYSWKMRWTEDVEPCPAAFDLTPARAEQIALHVHRVFEMERVGVAKEAAARKGKCTSCKGAIK